LFVQLMLEQISWRRTFGWLGAIGIVWVIPFYSWYRDDPRKHKGVNAGELALLPTADLHLPGSGIPWKTLLSSRTVWLLCAQWFCFDYGFYFYLTWFPSYLQERSGFDPHKAAALAGLPLLAAVAGGVLSAWIEPVLSKRLSSVARARRLLACFGLAAASGLLVAFSMLQQSPWALALLILSCFTSLFCQPIAWATCMDIGGNSVGTLAGIMNTAGQLAGATVSPTVAGWILQGTNHNWTPVFLVSAAFSFAGIVCWLFIDPITPLQSATTRGGMAV
jgi:sugar phosphate permease